MWWCLVRRSDKPPPTGDLACGLLLQAKDMIPDLELKELVTERQVNY